VCICSPEGPAGDVCRRVALYGVDMLIEGKKNDLRLNLLGVMSEEKIRLRYVMAGGTGSAFDRVDAPPLPPNPSQTTS